MIVDLKEKAFYVGSSLNLNRRLTEHKRDLKSGRHKNQRLQESWNNQQDVQYSIDQLFSRIEDYHKNQKTVIFVFIPLLDQKLPANMSKLETNQTRAEIQSYEQTLSELVIQHCGLKSYNYWLVLGTDDRESVGVCIDGIYYKNKLVAAQALNFQKNGKPDKQLIANRLEGRKWSTWMLVKSNKLIKTIRIMDSKGKRIGYQTYEYGTIDLSNQDNPTIKYYEKPILVVFVKTC